MIFWPEGAEDINYVYVLNQIFESVSNLWNKYQNGYAPTYGIVFVCISSCSGDKKIAHCCFSYDKMKTKQNKTKMHLAVFGWATGNILSWPNFENSKGQNKALIYCITATFSREFRFQTFAVKSAQCGAQNTHTKWFWPWTLKVGAQGMCPLFPSHSLASSLCFITGEELEKIFLNI